MAGLGSGSSGTMSYDELLLVLRWPPSFCNTGKKCDYPIPDNFTVHGLWLNDNSESVNCQKSSTRIQISCDLRQKMVSYWPDLQNRTHPEGFWGSEYNKHGSCVAEFGNPVDYFQTALDIAQRIGDVTSLMTMNLSSGLPLEMGQLYQVKDFEPVTTASGTFFPSLRCNKKGIQLHEIVFCTDRDGNPKNCTPNVRRNCCGQFKFPPGPQTASEEADPPGCQFEEADPPGSFEEADPPGSFGEPEFSPCVSSCPPGIRQSAISSEMQGNLVRDSELALNLRGS
nr:ribonuclease 1 [Quercus suber]